MALQRVDCATPVEFCANFPGPNGSAYRTTPAITLSEGDCARATGSSRVLREVERHELEDLGDLVCDFMLSHLRQQCRAQVDYEALRVVVAGLPDEGRFWFA